MFINPLMARDTLIPNVMDFPVFVSGKFNPKLRAFATPFKSLVGSAKWTRNVVVALVRFQKRPLDPGYALCRWRGYLEYLFPVPVSIRAPLCQVCRIAFTSNVRLEAIYIVEKEETD